MARILRTEIVPFRVTQAQRAKLTERAEALDLSVSDVIRVALNEYFARQLPTFGGPRPLDIP